MKCNAIVSALVAMSLGLRRARRGPTPRSRPATVGPAALPAAGPARPAPARAPRLAATCPARRAAPRRPGLWTATRLPLPASRRQALPGAGGARPSVARRALPGRAGRRPRLPVLPRRSPAARIPPLELRGRRLAGLPALPAATGLPLGAGRERITCWWPSPPASSSSSCCTTDTSGLASRQPPGHCPSASGGVPPGLARAIFL